jgi:hypothetical protein
MMRDEVNRIVADELLVMDNGGTLYATDRFWFAPVQSTVADLLRYWNLPIEADLRAEREGQRWFRAVMPAGVNAKKVEGLHPTGGATVVRDDRTKRPMFVDNIDGNAVAMFDTPGGRCYIRRDYLRLCAGEVWYDLAWKCNKPTGPLRHDGKDGLIAIMPVRLP